MPHRGESIGELAPAEGIRDDEAGESALYCRGKGETEQQRQHQQKEDEEEEEEEEKKVYERKITRAKAILVSPFRKFGKIYTRKKRRPPAPPFPYAENIGGEGCFVCFMQPRVPPHSPLRPNPEAPETAKPSSDYEFLKSLIEKNHFYSADCNVHRDIRVTERNRA